MVCRNCDLGVTRDPLVKNGCQVPLTHPDRRLLVVGATLLLAFLLLLALGLQW